MHRFSRYSGELQIAIGVLHTLLGLWAFRQPLAAIRQDRFVNAVG